MAKYCETEIVQRVPLDYQYPQAELIDLFARDIFLEGNEQAEILLFFNGGPGFSCVRDWKKTSWLLEALKSYRVILLDQRGTGRSQPIDLYSLKAFDSAECLSVYLSHFRADNIVRDAEFLRQEILQRQKITVLGQSYGGFIVLSYLSMAPQSLRGALITAGIAPLHCTSVDSIYQKLAKLCIEKNTQYYQRYPADKEKVATIVALLKMNAIEAAGEVLSLERFLDLGWYLGQEDGFESLHYLLDEAFCDVNMTQLSWRFVQNVLQATSFWQLNTLYSILHEAIYCNGFASNWAADRSKQKHSEFSLQQKLPYFSGEMVRRNMFQQYEGLHTLAKAAELLAQKTSWPVLYNVEVLSNNPVPIEALLMTDDFYVHYDLAITAMGHINNIKLWTHNTWHHDALRKHGKQVMRKMLKRLSIRLAKAID